MGQSLSCCAHKPAGKDELVEQPQLHFSGGYDDYMLTLRCFKYEPEVLTARNGQLVRIRLATAADKQAFIDHVLDQKGTGSGVSGDTVVIKFFDSFIKDPRMVVFWAEEATEPFRPLGMNVITFGTQTDSYWHTLRVAEAARGCGVAQLFWDVGIRVCIRVQGPDSISRWGIVSSNEIMVGWSTRKKLTGPERMTRFVATPAEAPNAASILPPGWTTRAPKPGDRDLILGYAAGLRGSFEVAKTKLKGLANMKYGNICPLDAAIVEKALANSQAPQGAKVEDPDWEWNPRICPLFLDEQGQLAAILLYVSTDNPLDPSKGMLYFCGFVDGTRKGIQVALEWFRHQVGEWKGGMIMTYVPSEEWLIADVEAGGTFKRGSQTQELIFHWKNADFNK